MAGIYASEGFEQITSLGTAKSLTPPANARYAVVNVEGGTARWRDDGTDPTTTVGMPMTDGTTMRFEGALAAVRLIQATGTVTVNVSYYA